MARCMTMAGVRPGMMVHNANGYGLFTGGLGFHQGGERIGATVVPVSGGFTGAPGAAAADLGAQVLVSTPSYALAIAQALSAAARAPELRARARAVRRRAVERGAARRRSSGALGLRAINFYGLSEMCGPGVAAECLEQRDGLHVQEDHFLVEVIDPGGRRRAGAGHARASSCSRTLTKEALPLIRYRTGDIGSSSTEPVRRAVVRTARLTRPARPPRRHADRARRQPSPLAGRAPAAERRRRVSPHYRLILERRGPLDELTLECEPVGERRPRRAARAARAACCASTPACGSPSRCVEPGQPPAQRGQGRPRHRPPLSLEVQLQRVPAVPAASPGAPCDLARRRRRRRA